MVLLQEALEQGWGTSDRNLSTFGHLNTLASFSILSGNCMAFAMDTAQVTTGHVPLDSPKELHQTCCGRGSEGNHTDL